MKKAAFSWQLVVIVVGLVFLFVMTKAALDIRDGWSAVNSSLPTTDFGTSNFNRVAQPFRGVVSVFHENLRIPLLKNEDYCFMEAIDFGGFFSDYQLKITTVRLEEYEAKNEMYAYYVKIATTNGEFVNSNSFITDKKPCVILPQNGGFLPNLDKTSFDSLTISSDSKVFTVSSEQGNIFTTQINQQFPDQIPYSIATFVDETNLCVVIGNEGADNPPQNPNGDSSIARCSEGTTRGALDIVMDDLEDCISADFPISSGGSEQSCYCAISIPNIDNLEVNIENQVKKSIVKVSDSEDQASREFYYMFDVAYSAESITDSNNVVTRIDDYYPTLFKIKNLKSGITVDHDGLPSITATGYKFPDMASFPIIISQNSFFVSKNPSNIVDPNVFVGGNGIAPVKRVLGDVESPEEWDTLFVITEDLTHLYPACQ